VLSVNPQPTGQQAASPQSAEPTAVTIIERVRRRWGSGERRSERPGLDIGWERRLETLEARTEHLEMELEGLQDAVHRRAVREDESIGDLRRRMEPDQIARDLGRNARTRGL
jgi:hypothetical protein